MDAVVFSSWYGRYSDSPRAVSAELHRRRPDLRQRWLLAPDAPDTPDHVERVPTGGVEAVRALESASWIVSNDVLPMAFDKQPGAIYLQTWHGTPLKRIGYDVEHPAFPDAEYHYAVEIGRDVARWDVLLSPNRSSTDRLRSAFRFGGPVVETGLPRNDALLAPGVTDRRDAVRTALGLRPDALAVLYAPTWRDDFAMTVELDLDAVHAALGDRVSLLVRAHGLTADRTVIAESPGAIDVTRWPDISDLYLAADVLVTDYSSAMVDFAVTGKPQLFYTYDLEFYRDQLRGFYVDFEACVPGPLLSTTAAVIDALDDLDEVSAGFRPAYDAFVQRFCPLDDGRASARAVESLLSSRAEHAGAGGHTPACAG